MFKDVSCAGALPQIHLDVQNPAQVFSPSMIDVFIGNPTNHMLIFTGVAGVGLGTEDDESKRAEVIIDLRTPVINMVSSTAIVGLASIGNEESDFIYATDEVAILPVNGNLELHVCVAVQGDGSGLNRISYQANVIVNIDEPLITGTVWWSEKFSPTAFPPRTDPLFTVQAFVLGSPHPPFDPQFDVPVGIPDSETQAPLPRDGVYSVPYALRDVPLNTPVQVRVTPNIFSFNGLGNAQFTPQQTSGPALPIMLIPLNMNVTNLDFELVPLDPA